MLFNNREDCQVCKYIRWYFMIGVPVVFFTWMQPDLYFLKGLNLGNIFATAIMIGLTGVVAWKYYDERGRK